MVVPPDGMHPRSKGEVLEDSTFTKEDAWVDFPFSKGGAPRPLLLERRAGEDLAGLVFSTDKPEPVRGPLPVMI